MEGKELAELKDEILRLIVDKEHGADHHWLLHQFNIEGLTTQYLIDVLKEIESFRGTGKLITLTIGQTHHIQRTPHTKSFLEKEGFVKEWELQRETAKRMNHNALRGQRIEELQEINLQLANRLNRQKLKTHVIPIVISLAALAWAIFKPYNNVSQQEYNKRIEQLEYNQKQLEKGLQLENKELQEKLHKADMWIRILEEKDSLNVG